MPFNSRNNSIAAAANKAKVTKIAKWVGGALGVVILASQFVLTVDKGNVASQSTFGKVDLNTVYSEGIHFPVNPLAKFTSMSVADQSIVMRGVVVDQYGKARSNGQVIIQTRDKMATGVDVEIFLQVNGAQIPHLSQQQVNTVADAVRKYVQPALSEALYNQGSSIASAQDLFTEQAKTQLKDGVLRDLRSYLISAEKLDESVVGAIIVKDVKIQRLALPPEIEDLIMETKKREEAEEIAKSSERRRQTDANAGLYEKQQAAEATKANAEAEAFRRMQNAEAMEREAAAKLVVAQKEAEGIAELNKQINPQYVQYLKAQATLTAAQNYKGDVPQTVMGADGNFVPF
ncbi:MAG: SPFH domain-containing protein, partial [Aeromonas veronii]